MTAAALFGTTFMVHAWIGGTLAAAAAALVGFFVVLKGASFVAHAVPQATFAGAAGAALIGMSPVLGGGALALAAALGLSALHTRHGDDAATGLVHAATLGLGGLFIAIGTVYAPAVFALLFGDILGISSSEIFLIFPLTLIIACAVAWLYRPLLLASLQPEIARARGVPLRGIETAFLLVVALASAVLVPIVGALLSFSLMAGPAAAASYLAQTPRSALVGSLALGVATMWLSIFGAYTIGWPVSFFATGLSAIFYLTARTLAHRRVRAALTAAHPAS